MSPDFSQTYPVYYVEQLLNQFAKAGDQVLPTTSTYGLLTAFATKRSDGTVRVLIINKNPTAVLSTQISFTAFTPGGSATHYAYGMLQDNAARIGRPQIVTATALKGVANNMPLTFSPYSVNVIEFAGK